MGEAAVIPNFSVSDEVTCAAVPSSDFPANGRLEIASGHNGVLVPVLGYGQHSNSRVMTVAGEFSSVVCMDFIAIGAVLQTFFHDALDTPWFFPAMSAAVAADGPVPVLPTEAVAMLTALQAASIRSGGLLFGLYAAMVIGSVAGDIFIFSVSRRGKRLGQRAGGRTAAALNYAVNRAERSPIKMLLTLRFLPAGRLLSVACMGRSTVSLRVLVLGSLISSIAWSAYIMSAGIVLGPIVGSSPWLSIAAALCVTGITALAGARLSRNVSRRSA